VTTSASPKTWWQALRRGQAPMFDEVFFNTTRAYVEREADAMRAHLGDAWLAELHATLDRAEDATAAWHAGEPRLWSLALRPRSWKPRGEAAMKRGQDKASAWLDGSIVAWQDEGRINTATAAGLREQMETPQFQAVVPHLGVHVAISVALRFPFGSIARASWSAGALLTATAKLLLRRSDRRAWKQAWDIHNPLVILLAGIPGFGTFAYMASKPVRSNRLLARVMLDAVMHKVPANLYERSGLRRLIVPRVQTRRPAAAPGARPVERGTPVLVPTPVMPVAAPAPVAAYARSAQPDYHDVAAWD
jgi:hypothetical protein